MNTHQIYTVLQSDLRVREYNFLGCFPLDRIPDSAKTPPCCMIINTKPHDHPGEHWVAIIKTEENYGVYFDSFGFPPHHLKEILSTLDQCTRWTHNKTCIQSPLTAVCGQYAIFFITHYCRGFTLDHIVSLLYSKDKPANDSFIFNYIKKKYSQFLFTENLKAIDLSFLYNQISRAINT